MGLSLGRWFNGAIFNLLKLKLFLSFSFSAVEGVVAAPEQPAKRPTHLELLPVTNPSPKKTLSVSLIAA